MTYSEKINQRQFEAWPKDLCEEVIILSEKESVMTDVSCTLDQIITATLLTIMHKITWVKSNEDTDLCLNKFKWIRRKKESTLRRSRKILVIEYTVILGKKKKKEKCHRLWKSYLSAVDILNDVDKVVSTTDVLHCQSFYFDTDILCRELLLSSLRFFLHHFLSIFLIFRWCKSNQY